MGDLNTVSFVVDTGLMLSLVLLAYRFFMPSGASKSGVSAQAEEQIKKLLEEANNATKSLNQILEKRQKTLEQTLFELETAETRINQTIVQAEEKKGHLERFIGAAQKLAKNVTPSRQSTPPVITSPLVEPPSFSEKKESAPEEAADAIEEASENSAPPKWGNVNIFGEVIGEEPATVLMEEAPKPAAKASAQSEIENVYRKAEEMIKAGSDLQQISTQTKLSMSEVKLLSDLVEKERQPVKKEKSALLSSENAQLGVLAGIRREIQTV